MSDGIEFGGEEHFTSPPSKVFNSLTDLDAIAGTIPDLVSSERVDAGTMKCVVRPGFSFLRGTLKMTMQLADVVADCSARMIVDAQGIGVTVRVESQLQVEPEGTGTKLLWNSRVTQLKGLIASVSPGLIRAAADQVIRSTWGKVRERLGD